MMRSIFNLFVCSAVVLAAAAPALAAETGSAAEARAMAEKAAMAVKADKSKALAQFQAGEAGFKDRDLYVFCIGADGRFSAHPTLKGQDARALKDPNGKAFAVEMISVAKDGQFAEVDYMFVRPGGTQPAPKSSYVTRVSEEVCGVGYYK